MDNKYKHEVVTEEIMIASLDNIIVYGKDYLDDKSNIALITKQIVDAVLGETKEKDTIYRSTLIYDVDFLYENIKNNIKTSDLDGKKVFVLKMPITVKTLSVDIYNEKEVITEYKVCIHTLHYSDRAIMDMIPMNTLTCEYSINKSRLS